MLRKSLYLLPIWGWFILIGMIACYAQGNQYTEAAQKETQPSTKMTLAERVDAFWQARKIGDSIAAYEFEEVKATGELSLQQYVRQMGNLVYKEVKVLRTELTGSNEAHAHLVAEVIVMGLPEPIKTEFKDAWVYIDGNWYHKQQNTRSK